MRSALPQILRALGGDARRSEGGAAPAGRSRRSRSEDLLLALGTASIAVVIVLAWWSHR